MSLGLYITISALIGFLPLVAAVAPRGAASSSSNFHVPAYYPAPYGGWVDTWAGSYSRAKALVDTMTLAEKTNITAGSGLLMGMIRLEAIPRLHSTYQIIPG